MPPETKTQNNSEIDQALKEFEVQSDNGDKQQTGEIPKAFNPEVPKIVQLVMKYSGGAIKEQKTAEYVLLGFVVVAIGISLFLFFGAGPSDDIKPFPEDVVNQPQI